MEQQAACIVLIDSSTSSLTVSWPIVDGALRYALEYKNADYEDDDNKFELLSDKLTQTQARKKNLKSGASFIFRVAGIKPNPQDPSLILPISDEDWITHEEPFTVLPDTTENTCMESPTVVPSGAMNTLVVSWKAPDNVDTSMGYELQCRQNSGGTPWETIATVSNTIAKKKNLISPRGYQFRVKPKGNAKIPFSPASDPMVAIGFSLGLKQFFSPLEDGTLVAPKTTATGKLKKVSLEDALGGKEFVLLYASAHWCPPCRQFTPMLSRWYQNVLQHDKIVQVVFLSCDQNEEQFQEYFTSSHPWMAVDYTDDGREDMLAKIKVSGIPRLVVLCGKTGRVLEDNGVGKPFDIQRWRNLASSKN